MSNKRTQLCSEDEANEIIAHGNFEEMIKMTESCKKRGVLCEELKREIGKYMIPRYFMEEAIEFIRDKRKTYSRNIKINKYRTVMLIARYKDSKYDQEKLHNILLEYPDVAYNIKKEMVYSFKDAKLEITDKVTFDAFNQDIKDITTCVYGENIKRGIKITNPKDITNKDKYIYSISLSNQWDHIKEDFYTQGMIVDNVDYLEDYLSDKDRDGCLDLRYKIHEDLKHTEKIKRQIHKALIQKHYQNECKVVDKDPTIYVEKDYINPRTNKVIMKTFITSATRREKTHEDMLHLKNKYQLSDNVMRTRLTCDETPKSKKILKSVMRRFDEIEGSDEEILNDKISQIRLTSAKNSKTKNLTDKDI